MSDLGSDNKSDKSNASDTGSDAGDETTVPSICLEWRDIRITVKTKDKKSGEMVDKELLHGLEGLGNPG